MATGQNAPVNGGQAMNGGQQHTKIGTDADPTRGMPYHDKLTADLKQALAKKKMLERSLVCLPVRVFTIKTNIMHRPQLTSQYTRKRANISKKHHMAISSPVLTTTSRALQAAL